MSDLEQNKKDAELWFRHLLAEESPVTRLGMIGGVMWRLAGNLVDTGLKEAGTLMLKTVDAFWDGISESKEVDVEDANVLEDLPKTPNV